MTHRKSWLARMSRAARWMLPRKEAEEVIADYTDLLAEDTRTEEELERDLGDPVQAVKLLVRPNGGHLRQAVFGALTSDRRWLAAFCALAVCLLAAATAYTPLSPAFMLGKWYEWSCYDVILVPFYLLPVGQVLAGTFLALAVFHRRAGEARKPLPKGFLLCALLMLAGIAAAWYFVWQVSTAPNQFLTTWIEERPQRPDADWVVGYRGITSPGIISMYGWLEWACCALSGVVGMIGLWKARMENRRWSAVYVLALTLAVLAMAVIAMLYNFSGVRIGDFYNDLTDHWFRLYILRFVLITVPGLIGAGVALC